MAYSLSDLPQMAVLFVIASVIIGMGAKILQDVELDTYAASGNTNGTAVNAIRNGTAALGNLGEWLPTIATILIAALIIGVVVASFYFAMR